MNVCCIDKLRFHVSSAKIQQEITMLLLMSFCYLCCYREGEKPQNDEDDMGMTYEELGVYGRLRKIVRCGPVSMFKHCCQLWRDRYSIQEISDKVGRGVSFRNIISNNML